MNEIVVILHNIRSTHNVGSMLRTCDGFGVNKVYISGYTPYPIGNKDDRLPHLAKKIDFQIHKTALGAEKYVDWEKIDEPLEYLKRFSKKGYKIVALEQNEKSVNIYDFKPYKQMVLVVGEEVNGVPKEILKICEQIIEIPMLGKKESFNVSVSLGLALYQCRI